MKNFVVLGIYFSILMACNRNDPLPAPKSNVGEIIDSGEISPAEPVSEDEVFKVTEDAKRTLRLYFNYERQYNWEDVGGVYRKFIFAKENLSTRLEKVHLEVLRDKPCKDSSGNDAETGIVGSRPNTICLSSFRLAFKLNKENARKEILAIITHELGHSLGATEEEAVELQKLAASKFTYFTEQDSRNIPHEVQDKMERFSFFSSLRELFSKLVKSGDLPELKQRVHELSDLIHKYHDDWENIDAPLRYVDYLVLEYQKVIIAKLRLLEYYIDSRDILDPEARWSREEYDKCFAGKKAVTAKELAENCTLGPNKENIYGNLVVERIKDHKGILKLTSEVLMYIQNMSARLRSILMDQPLSTFDLPKR